MHMVSTYSTPLLSLILYGNYLKIKEERMGGFLDRLKHKPTKNTSLYFWFKKPNRGGGLGVSSMRHFEGNCQEKKKWIEPNFMTTYFVHIYKLVLSAYSITQYYEKGSDWIQCFFVKKIITNHWTYMIILHSKASYRYSGIRQWAINYCKSPL